MPRILVKDLKRILADVPDNFRVCIGFRDDSDIHREVEFDWEFKTNPKESAFILPGTKDRWPDSRY